ncbi:hypothetical protein X777_16952 [Ooceraea biroi]|uniref:Uncharacterized protein n=1 Tax=Ooceraea biroi TaxID=2015173 RepID=A0A026WSI2_OOCBI|nr:hypothetical protein X777_16952 [Ooceraea biroi]
MSNVTCIGNPEEKYVATIDKIRDTIRKLEASLKCSRELEAARFLRYSTLKSREKILTDDLKKAKIRDEHMLNLFRQSVTDIQLDSVNILPETLKRRVQRTWHQKYDALLSQNKRLRKKIVAMDCTLKEKQKEISTLQQRLLNIAENVVTPEENTEKICRKCWILTNKI